MKKIADFTLFIGGAPNYPPRVYATYRVVSGNAKSELMTHIVHDSDTSKSLKTVWNEVMAEVKTLNGIDIDSKGI